MNTQLLEINTRGELIDPILMDDIKEKYKPDSPFLKGFVPYIILILCGLSDYCFFYSLFSVVSYHAPALMAVQIAGFLFGFDVIPIYLGIHFKKLQQGFTRDTFTFKLALVVCALICVLNIGMRAVTVDIMSPDLSGEGESYFDQAAQEEDVSQAAALEEEASEDQNTADVTAWMMAIVGMVVPIVTSVGSFYVSCHCYDPMMIKLQKEEKLIHRKEDRIRRLQAMIRSYEADEDVTQRMLDDDEKEYAAARAMTLGVLLEGYDYVSQRLMAQMQSPASTSMLSQQADREELLHSLDRLCLQTGESAALPALSQGTHI